MKIFLLISVLISSSFALVYFDMPLLQESETILIHTTTHDPLASTNHNWSNQ